MISNHNTRQQLRLQPHIPKTPDSYANKSDVFTFLVLVTVSPTHKPAVSSYTCSQRHVCKSMPLHMAPIAHVHAFDMGSMGKCLIHARAVFGCAKLGPLTNLDSGVVTLKANDLTNQLVSTNTNELIHGSACVVLKYEVRMSRRETMHEHQKTTHLQEGHLPAMWLATTTGPDTFLMYLRS